jgi:hypothetical protein
MFQLSALSNPPGCIHGLGRVFLMIAILCLSLRTFATKARQYQAK